MTNPNWYVILRYNQRERENMIELGTKIIGNFGAMISPWEGEVTEIRKCCWTKSNKNDKVTVTWDNDDECRGKPRRWVTIKVGQIDSNPSVNGSPIGYYTEEAYYA